MEKYSNSESNSRMVCRSIVGLVVEFVVAIDEARVRFTDDALSFFLFLLHLRLLFSPNHRGLY